MKSFGGEQTTYLENVMDSTEVISRNVKFIVYHVPLYSSTGQWNTNRKALEGQKNWVPLFDKYNVTAAFENHVHAFKRTEPMVASKYDSSGTVYLGDGLWGVPASDIPSADMISSNQGGRLAVSGRHHHVWRVDVKDKGSHTIFQAVGTQKQILDKVERYTDKEGLHVQWKSSNHPNARHPSDIAN